MGMITTRSPYYLQKWIETFQCHVDQSRKETFGGAVESDNEKSVGTFDTEDKDVEEYLIDIYDGMDMPDIQMEGGLEIERVQQKTPSGMQEMGEGDGKGAALQMESNCGNIELIKRKPPDGKQDTKVIPSHLARCDTA